MLEVAWHRAMSGRENAEKHIPTLDVISAAWTQHVEAGAEAEDEAEGEDEVEDEDD